VGVGIAHMPACANLPEVIDADSASCAIIGWKVQRQL